MSDIHALSGAYAVDALDDVERRSFEQHLATCPECRAEVQSFRETAAIMAELEAEEAPPASLRATVLAGIGQVRPFPPETPVVQSSVPVPALVMLRRRMLPTLVAAAAVLILVTAGAFAWHPWRSGQTSLADQVTSAPDAVRVTKILPGGTAKLTLVRSASLDRAVMLGDDVPEPPAGKTYQLWLQEPGKGLVSAGLMPDSHVPTVLTGDLATATAAAVSVEPAKGSAHPTGQVVAVFPDDMTDDMTGDTTRDSAGPRRIAVIGSGVAGLTAAHVAARSAQVSLYEADSRLGGHADTHEVGGFAIDTGFIVHNARTYPTLVRLFAEIGVATQPSEMSMSVRDEETGLEYAGALGARGLFPTIRTLSRPAYLRMLGEVPRFHRQARALIEESSRSGDTTLREFLAEGGFSAYFCRQFMEPLVAAVWSCDPAAALDYPARYLFEFLSHHGMLSVTGSPQWRTVVGGSREYVARVAAGLNDVRAGTKVTSVLETGDGVRVTDGNGATTTYDGVVVATHPDQALAMLAEPTEAQRHVLSAMPYSDNTALLHTDTSLLPRAEHARASWNFLRPRGAGRGAVTVTYDLTRLQQLPTETRYLVTLGGADLVDPERVIERMEYAHPIYTPESVAAQRRLPEANTTRIAFAGAYHGWGFHEDGARAGAAAAEHLGLSWDEPGLPIPGMYESRIRHTRRRPFRKTFDHRADIWLVDLDALPDHGVLGTFEARDHLGSPDLSLRENLDAFLAEHGVDIAGGRVLMAANARAFGYCFNPISVFWCFDRDRRPAGVVLEVHNTYGGRHPYLIHPDERGRGRVDKALYVSPFHGTDGWYDVHVPVPGDELQVAVNLHTLDGAVFSASLAGRRTQVSARRAAPAALRGSMLIRAHGIGLWLRRLPVQPRPAGHDAGPERRAR